MTDDEVIVYLADGWTIRSGCHTLGLTSGEWVRICRPDGSEYVYWHHDEFEEGSVLVLGAFINAAAGFRPDDDGHDNYKAIGSCGLRGCVCGGKRVQTVKEV